MENKKMMIDEDLFRMLYQYFIFEREDLREEISEGHGCKDGHAYYQRFIYEELNGRYG